MQIEPGSVGRSEEWVLSHQDGVTKLILTHSLPDPGVEDWAEYFRGLYRGCTLFVATLELDLHFSADGEVIVWHDPVIDPEKCGLRAGALAGDDYGIVTFGALIEFGIRDRVTVQSFDFQSLHAIHRSDPGIRLATLTAGDADPAVHAELGASIWSPKVSSISERRMAEAREAGLLIIPWAYRATAAWHPGRSHTD